MEIFDYLQTSDLRHLRFGFYKLVYIRPTQFCPANCRHCSARSGPGTPKTADVEVLKQWVTSIVALPDIEWIGIEGGEPFAALEQLKTILQTAQEHGVLTSVLTNAYWARNERKIREILEELPKINFLIISADEFHEEYIPLSRVMAALRVARDYVDRLGVQTCTGPNYPAFQERFRRLAGDNLLEGIDFIEVPLQYIGRAKETGIMRQPEKSNELPDSICHFLGTPVLREDGIFVACCQQNAVLSRQQNILHLGNLNESDAAELKSRVNSDVYFQTLRVFGPKVIAEAALKFNWGWEPATYHRGHVCELCLHLASNPQVVEGFREMYDTPVYKSKLALGRSLLFNELLPNSPKVSKNRSH